MLLGELATIKRNFGGHSYRLVAEGDLSRLEQVAGIAQTMTRDGSVKLLLEPEASGPEILGELVQILSVREFHSEEPDLEEIFIKAVQDASG